MSFFPARFILAARVWQQVLPPHGSEGGGEGEEAAGPAPRTKTSHGLLPSSNTWVIGLGWDTRRCFQDWWLLALPARGSGPVRGLKRFRVCLCVCGGWVVVVLGGDVCVSVCAGCVCRVGGGAYPLAHLVDHPPPHTHRALFHPDPPPVSPHCLLAGGGGVFQVATDAPPAVAWAPLAVEGGPAPERVWACTVVAGGTDGDDDAPDTLLIFAGEVGHPRPGRSSPHS
jgi:hypothetical protein